MAASPAAPPAPAGSAPDRPVPVPAPSPGPSTTSSPPSVPSAPAPASAPPPAAPSPRSPAAAPAPVAAAEPLTGSVSDRGAVRHDLLRTLEWSVDGASKVLGSAEAGFARLHGMVTVGGDLTAVDLRADGTLTVDGKSRFAGTLTLRGTGRFQADLRAAKLTTEGRLEVTGALAVTGAAVVSGVTEVTGPVDAGSLTFAGALRVGGSVSAEEITGTLQGSSRTGPIRATTVTIARGSGAPWRTPGRLTTLRIEASTAYLTGVTVEYLKADAVHLGPDCRVARLEGRLLTRHRTSRVGPSSVSEPPPGISR
ncbi:MAG: hypothetical protein ACYDFT_01235 [Thermoplasmata archaeon]